MNATSNRKRFTRITAIVFAGTVVGITGAALVADAGGPSHTPSNGCVSSELVAWAQSNHVSGLSPASLVASDHNFRYDASYAAEMQQIAKWAKSQGLSGLSPESLQPVSDGH